MRLSKSVYTSYNSYLFPQPKAAKRGSGQISLQDLDKLDVITKQLQEENPGLESNTNEDIQRLREYTKQLKEQLTENDDDNKKS